MIKIELDNDLVADVRTGIAQQRNFDRLLIIIPESLVKRMMDVIKKQAEGNSMLAVISSIVVSISTENLLRSQVHRAKGGLTYQQYETVTQFVEDNLAQEFQVSDLAKLVGLSVNHFIYVFRQSIESTPHRYILGQRVARAKTLLLSDNRSLSEIALTVGFASQSHFTYHFRKVTGTTPARFRRTFGQ